ncbi:MAG TPA: lamin tail domain-containing protein [Kofleriaceae bacterium]|nr:lamin tail domain-containing protein [Kofleriaceae bacterium]
MRRLAVLSTFALAACGPPAPTTGVCMHRLPGDLVITEVFADYAGASGDGGDAGREWIEIFNTTAQPIELAGITVSHSRADGSRGNAHVMRAATIAPGQYFTLGNAADGALPPYLDYGYGDDLGELFNSDGGKLALACDGAEIDSAPYTDVKPGHARALGAGERPDYTRNDDPAHWCQAVGAEFTAGNFGTPGAENDCAPLVVGQCRDGDAMRDAAPPGPGDLVITEIMASPAHVADTAGEWFEARAIHDVDLNGVGLDRVHDTARPSVIAGGDCVHVAAGSFAVFARSADAATNGGLPAVTATFGFSLVAGSASAPGDLTIVAGDTVIDAVTWTAAPHGAALQLDPDLVDPIANDSASNFCPATTAYGAGDLGTPGAANPQCARLPTPGTCDDGSAPRAIAAPAAGQLVISEVLANPAGASDASREWFEVANTGATAFDLNELVVGRIAAAGTPIASARCLSVAPGGFAVLARAADPVRNAGLPRVDATFAFGLVDTRGDIQIARGDGAVLDAVQWAAVTSGVSLQVDPAQLTAEGNDDPSHWCAASAPYGDGANLGTPGAGNACR